jgi:hypothetical protein
MMHVAQESRAGGAPAAAGTGKILGCAAVCCISAAALGLMVHHGLGDTYSYLSGHSLKANARNDRQEECIYHAIRSRLPKGAAIYVPNYAYGDEVRANDLATLWAVPQSGPATAQWVVSLTRGTECEGLTLRIRHL